MEKPNYRLSEASNYDFTEGIVSSVTLKNTKRTLDERTFCFCQEFEWSCRCNYDKCGCDKDSESQSTECNDFECPRND